MNTMHSSTSPDDVTFFFTTQNETKLVGGEIGYSYLIVQCNTTVWFEGSNPQNLVSSQVRPRSSTLDDIARTKP